MLLGPSVAALLLTAVGCSSTDSAPPVAVPTPDAKAAGYCRALHEELPKSVAGLDRDTGTKSELIAEWGDGAIVLRCGVPRPAKMDDPMAKGIEADDVAWMLEQAADGASRFTTTYRKAYVELYLPEKYAHDVTPLAAFAPAIRKTVPESL